MPTRGGLQRRGSPVVAKSLLIAVSFLSTLRFVLAVGTSHVVGDKSGWNVNVNYTTWARSRTFVAGDSLLFHYIKTAHTVSQVSEADFESCNVRHAVNTWFDGATVINLPSAGRFYYVCGIPGHCNTGQKVAVRVVAAGVGDGLHAFTPTQGPAAAIEGNASPRTLQQALSTGFLLLVAMFMGFASFW